jgi:hypothetical protein
MCSSIIEVTSRRVLHFNVTRHPTADWSLQQLRECIVGNEGYRFVIHDRDRIYSRDLDAGIKTLGLTVLKTPRKAPKANAICERWIGSARRECLGLHDSDQRGTHSPNTEMLGATLQSRPPTLQSRTRNTRSEFAEVGATSNSAPQAKLCPPKVLPR